MSQLSTIRRSVCNRISDDLEDLVSEVENFRDTMRDTVNDVANKIHDFIVPIDPYEQRAKVSKAISDINKNMEKIVPAVKDFNEILDILDQCLYLQVDTFLSDPVTLTNQILDYLKSTAMDNLFAITDIVEMTLAKYMQDFVDLIPSVEITGFDAYALIQCLTAMCGQTNLENSYARLHNAFHDLCLNGVGKLDINRWYMKGGLNPIDSLDALRIENMNMGVSTINGVYRSVENNCNQAVEIFKRIPTI
jgi:hypothetical protein